MLNDRVASSCIQKGLNCKDHAEQRNRLAPSRYKNIEQAGRSSPPMNQLIQILSPFASGFQSMFGIALGSLHPH